MYSFGDQKENADLLMRAVAAQSGPGITELELDKCDKEEIRNRYIYASAALRAACRDGMDEDLIWEACVLYESLLVTLCWHTDAILMAMEANSHSFPWKDEGAMVRQRLLVERTCEARRERDRNDQKNQRRRS